MRASDGVISGRRATNRLAFQWLVVRESELPGVGWGLVVGRHFEKDKLITAYVGVLSHPGGDIVRKVEYHGSWINVPEGTKEMFLGAHFANNPYYGMSPEERN